MLTTSLSFPRLYAAASLKRDAGARTAPRVLSFPRLYAAASLKPEGEGRSDHGLKQFSAALCRGLIEAGISTEGIDSTVARFPRLYAAASLKQSVHLCFWY